MDAANLRQASNEVLLSRLIGVRQQRAIYDGSLRPLFSPTAPPCPGSEKLAVAQELVKRWLSEEMKMQCVLTNPSAIRDFLRIHFANQEYESFLTLFLDAQNRLIAAEELFRGTLTQTAVYPREIVKAALRQNAASVVFAHNHPSGEARPSMADRSLTKALSEVLALIDVRVLDHFVVGISNVFSFAENGEHL